MSFRAKPILVLAIASMAIPNSAAVTVGHAVVHGQSRGSTRSIVLQRIFTTDILGANVEYLERITGPAFSTYEHQNTYKVDGCKVIVGIANSKVENIGIDGVTKHCNFDVAAYFAISRGAKLPSQPTFGDVESVFSFVRISADCVESCGNAADPVVSLHYEGSHADNWNSLLVSVQIIREDALQASEIWARKMDNKFGADYVIDAKFNCGDNLNTLALNAFRLVKATTVRVGANLIEYDCRSGKS